MMTRLQGRSLARRRRNVVLAHGRLERRGQSFKTTNRQILSVEVRWKVDKSTMRRLAASRHYRRTFFGFHVGTIVKQSSVTLCRYLNGYVTRGTRGGLPSVRRSARVLRPLYAAWMRVAAAIQRRRQRPRWWRRQALCSSVAACASEEEAQLEGHDLGALFKHSLPCLLVPTLRDSDD